MCFIVIVYSCEKLLDTCNQCLDLCIFRKTEQGWSGTKSGCVLDSFQRKEMDLTYLVDICTVHYCSGLGSKVVRAAIKR